MEKLPSVSTIFGEFWAPGHPVSEIAIDERENVSEDRSTIKLPLLLLPLRAQPKMVISLLWSLQ